MHDLRLYIINRLCIIFGKSYLGLCDSSSISASWISAEHLHHPSSIDGYGSNVNPNWLICCLLLFDGQPSLALDLDLDLDRWTIKPNTKVRSKNKTSQSLISYILHSLLFIPISTLCCITIFTFRYIYHLRIYNLMTVFSEKTLLFDFFRLRWKQLTLTSKTTEVT